MPSLSYLAPCTPTKSNLYYNEYNYVYIHIYMQSKTQQFIRWYHYVICNTT